MEKQEINWEKISLDIITYVSVAKTKAFSALRLIKTKDWMKADNAVVLGEEEIKKALIIHSNVITEEANGTKLDFKMLFMHAEDQLLSTQTLLELVKELVSVFKTFNN